MYWSLTPEGASLLREAIINEFATLTNFAAHFQTREVAIQAVSKFLRGENITVDLAREMTAAVIADVDGFRREHVRLVPFGRFAPEPNEPDMTDLALEALVCMSPEEQAKFLRQCYLITKNNG